MEKHIVGKNFDLGTSLRAHIDASLQHVIDKYFEEAINCHVVVTKNGLLVHTAIEIHAGPGMMVYGDANNEDPYASADQAIHTVENNLRRYKNRFKAHHSKHDMSKEEKAMYYVLHEDYRNFDTAEETEEEHDQPSIVAETTAYVPTLSVSEAVMRLDLSGNSALLFRNKAHQGLNMVYIRKDRNVGWIDPKGNKTN